MSGSVREDAASQPLWTLEYDLSREYYEKALRHSALIHWLRQLVLLVLFLLVFDMGLNLYYSVSRGLPFTELLKATFVRNDPVYLYVYAGLFLFHAVTSLVFRPAALIRRASVLFGNDGKCRMTYLFLPQKVRCIVSGKETDGRQDIDYDQITRVRVRKYDIFILSSRKNALSIHKEALSREDEQKVLDILRVHCPQVRSLDTDDGSLS